MPASAIRGIGCILGSALFFTIAGNVYAETVLKASHQWPTGTGDIRDEMLQRLAQAAADAKADLSVRVYPGQSLLKARDQWSALIRGQVDIIALPLDYASGRHPQFSATLMPGLVKDHAHAGRLNDSEFMRDIKRIIQEAGALVLADAWVAGGFVSTKRCILWPGDIKGQVTRGAGPAFERMLVAAGASISSMPSSDIYSAMQTKVLDAANTSLASFISYRIYEQVKCLTAPGNNALWFMYEPVLVSKRSWQRLTDRQRSALSDAGQAAEDYFAEASSDEDAAAEAAFRNAGVEVVHMTREQADAWRAIAETSAYDVYAREVPGGADLIQKALAVE
jgi:TRAP-type C4-dicarboxylate transport system substrate-binding protein